MLPDGASVVAKSKFSMLGASHTGCRPSHFLTWCESCFVLVFFLKLSVAPWDKSLTHPHLQSRS